MSRITSGRRFHSLCRRHLDTCEASGEIATARHTTLIAAGDLQINFDDALGCGSPVKTLDIELLADYWVKIGKALAAQMNSASKSPPHARAWIETRLKTTRYEFIVYALPNNHCLD